jgi:hypothetical protein
MWIYRISDDDDKAVLEDELGFYLVRYKIDFEKKSVALGDVVFESELVTPLEAIGEDSYDIWMDEKEFEKIYTRDAKGMESYAKIEAVLLSYYFPSVADLDLIQESLVLVRSNNRNSYFVALKGGFDNQKSTVIRELTIGNPIFLTKLVKPINSVLLMYSKSSKNQSEVVVIRLAQRIVESTKALMGLIDGDELAWKNIKASDLAFIESAQAKIYVLSTVINAIADATNGLVKDRCQLSNEGAWLKVELRSSKRFNLTKFRDDNPDLYEKYLFESKTPFLVKQGRSKANFPLSEDSLKAQIGASFKVLE